MLQRTLTVTILCLVASSVRAEPKQDHWAWKPVVRPSIPTVKGDKPANTIDAFIRAKLDAVDLKLTAAATKEQLIRRVTFDLTGLAPTPQEIDAFLKDDSANAWERVVDRLLNSQQYGERWARHWLDLVRYADSNGYEFDEPRPDAWRYRDYVIRSFNSDKPYDRFIIEQLAGDEAFPGDAEALIATGFNLLGPDMTDASDQAQRRYNTLSDMTDTTGLAFLGLTMGCARCHDHKFEPISQVDYFRLQAFFTPAVFRRDLAIATPEQRAAHETATRDYAKLTQTLRDDMAAIEEPVRKRLQQAKLAKLSPEAQEAHRTPATQRTGGQQELVAETEKKVAVSAAEITAALSADDKKKLAKLREELKTFDSRQPKPLPVAMGLTDKPGPVAKTHLLERGNLSSPAKELSPGFPTIVTTAEPTIRATANSSGHRLALAKWIASPNNPLTARVLVNRLWHHHFGRGIVATPSDFGVRGDNPTHPELLDFLAAELINNKWSLKSLHRLMLTSETYRQATTLNNKAVAVDPDNDLLWRMNRLRLEGEAVRDTLLNVSGQLNPTTGGPGVVLPEIAAAAGGSRTLTVAKEVREQQRRTVYLFARRNLRYSFLEALDLPDSNLSCPKRERSTTAPQALALLNSPLAADSAKAFAERLTKEASTDAERVRLAYRYTLGRWPTAVEQERAERFLEQSPLKEMCRALFNVNEFVYLD
jgi:hypothetical protein